MLHRPLSKKHLVTGNYLIDYQDTYRHFGAMIQAVIIGNPVSNIPTVASFTLNNHGAGMSLNQVSVSKWIKILRNISFNTVKSGVNFDSHPCYSCT